MKKKNKNKSLVSQTIHMFVIQSALLGIVIVTYICVSYYTVLENMQTSSRNLLQLYGKELENKLENADMLLVKKIVTAVQDENFMVGPTAHLSESLLCHFSDQTALPADDTPLQV